jgi:hypothetical protein
MTDKQRELRRERDRRYRERKRAAQLSGQTLEEMAERKRRIDEVIECGVLVEKN